MVAHVPKLTAEQALNLKMSQQYRNGPIETKKQLYKNAGIEKSVDNLKKKDQEEDALTFVSGVQNPIKRHKYTNENADEQSLLSAKTKSLKNTLRSLKDKKLRK